MNTPTFVAWGGDFGQPPIIFHQSLVEPAKKNLNFFFVENSDTVSAHVLFAYHSFLLHENDWNYLEQHYDRLVSYTKYIISIQPLYSQHLRPQHCRNLERNLIGRIVIAPDANCAEVW